MTWTSNWLSTPWYVWTGPQRVFGNPCWVLASLLFLVAVNYISVQLGRVRVPGLHGRRGDSSPGVIRQPVSGNAWVQEGYSRRDTKMRLSPWDCIRCEDIWYVNDKIQLNPELDYQTAQCILIRTSVLVCLPLHEWCIVIFYMCGWTPNKIRDYKMRQFGSLSICTECLFLNSPRDLC